MGLLGRLLPWLRSWWSFLAFCVVAAFLIKIFVIAGYTIPTESMEPFLHGHERDGDRVAVFKPYFSLFEPERFDLVVFEVDADRLGDTAGSHGSGTESVLMVKRLIGLPGEQIRIGTDGDVFIGNPPRRLKKTFSQIESLLIPIYRSRFDNSFFDVWQAYRDFDRSPKVDPEALEKGWTIEDDLLRCNAASDLFEGREINLTYGPEISDSYLDDQQRAVPGTFPVNDLCLTMEITVLRGTQGCITGRLREGGDRFKFELHWKEGQDNLIRLIRNRVPVVTEPVDPDVFANLEHDRCYTFRFLNIDNQVRLFCDDRLLCGYTYDDNVTVDSTALHNQPSFGVQGLDVEFNSVKIDRDVHYAPIGRYARHDKEPYIVPEGHYFFLGDNSSKSEDSRMIGAVNAERIKGRPFLIFYPFSRIRFF